MSYLLLWAAPALLIAGLVTGGARATRTVIVICVAVAALMVIDVVHGAHALATGQACDIVADCPTAGATLFGAAFAIGAILIAHVIGRWIRDGLDRLAPHCGASHAR